MNSKGRSLDRLEQTRSCDRGVVNLSKGEMALKQEINPPMEAPVA